MDILRILEDRHYLAVEKPKHVGPIFWGVNTDEIGMQIAKVRASLPNELKAAVATVRESERIVEGAKEDATMALESARKEGERILLEARREAERIVEQAKLQQEKMVHDSEILKLSKAQSEEIRSAADREAHQMRRGAEKYAFDVLGQLETVVGKVMTTIDRGKQEIKPNEAPQAVVREKARV
jgi:vacuolar-type H+-ATPase subunit H